MYDQEFRLYNLQPIHLPLPNQENQWMIAIHKPYTMNGYFVGAVIYADDITLLDPTRSSIL